MLNVTFLKVLYQLSSFLSASLSLSLSLSLSAHSKAAS